MIGDQRYAEALGRREIRLLALVGERCRSLEAAGKPQVELRQVRMQT